MRHKFKACAGWKIQNRSRLWIRVNYVYVECRLIAILFWLSQLVTGASNGIVRVRNSTDGTVNHVYDQLIHSRARIIAQRLRTQP